MTADNVLAVIGGSGLYDIDGLTDVEEVRVDTPFGPPSDAIVRGRLEDTTLLFLPRHGRGHRIPPHQIDYRANVCALKKLGATHLVSVSAVGSMKEAIAPGRLRRRRSVHRPDEAARLDVLRATGSSAHVAFADPVCADLVGGPRRRAAERARRARCTAAARTSASRARSSRRAPRASSTARGACRSSA